MKFIFTVLLILSYSFESQSESHGIRSGLQCNFDQRLFDIKYEISKSTLPKAMFKIENSPDKYYRPFKKLFIMSGDDLLLVSKKKSYYAVTFRASEMDWYLLRNFHTSEEKECHPSESQNKDPRQKWNCCKVTSDTTPKNKSYIRLKHSEFSKSWLSDLKSSVKNNDSKFLKKTYSKEYDFIQNGEAHKVTIKATAKKNPNYLKNYNCRGDSKINTCGENCLKYSKPVNPEGYSETESFRLNLSTDSKQAIIEFKLQYYINGNEDIQPDLKELKISLEKTLSAQKENLNKGLLFYSLSSMSNTVVKETRLLPSEIKFTLY